MTRAGVSTLTTTLPASLRPLVVTEEIVETIDSTNAALLAAPPPPPGSARVLLAREQTAGRGRRGRRWVAPRDGALCLSIAWTFASLPRDAAALSLVAGVCARRALENRGVMDVALKWPNDLVVGDRKLGGILIETRTEACGALFAVLGFGVNLVLTDAVRTEVGKTGTDAIDCAELMAAPPTAVELATAILQELLAALPRFAAGGLAPFREAWERADALRGRAVTVRGADAIEDGVARGIEPDGSFRLETPAGLRRIAAGDVSVRAAGT